VLGIDLDIFLGWTVTAGIPMSSGRKQPEETPLVTSKRLQVENLSNYQLQLFDLTKRGPEVTRKPFESASQGHLSLANQDLVSITDQQREISGQLLDRSPAQLVVGVLLEGKIFYQRAPLPELKPEKVPLPVSQGVHGPELFNILNEDLGTVEKGEDGGFSWRFILSTSGNPGTDTARLLGRIAEALIVRQCQQNLTSNER
jgi:hypothetical protein